MRARMILLAAALAVVPLSAQRPTKGFGKFVGEVVAKFSDDGRTMTLIQDFAYIAPDGFRWDAPKGSTIDGASIPQFAWSIIGGPFEGKYRLASVVHDVACVRKAEPWERVHRAFYTAMLAAKVELLRAKVMYAAVYHFGPRWEYIAPCLCFEGYQVVKPEPRTLTEEQFNELATDIARREPSPSNPVTRQGAMSLDEIDLYGKAEK
jgi:hypothetical protein